MNWDLLRNGCHNMDCTFSSLSCRMNGCWTHCYSTQTTTWFTCTRTSKKVSWALHPPFIWAMVPLLQCQCLPPSCHWCSLSMLRFSDVLLFSSMFYDVLHCFFMFFYIVLMSKTKCSSLSAMCWLHSSRHMSNAWEWKGVPTNTTSFKTSRNIFIMEFKLHNTLLGRRL